MVLSYQQELGESGELRLLTLFCSLIIITLFRRSSVYYSDTIEKAMTKLFKDVGIINPTLHGVGLLWIFQWTLEEHLALKSQTSETPCNVGLS